MIKEQKLLTRSIKKSDGVLQHLPDTQTLKVNVKDIKKICKDFNMIQLPFFVFGKLAKQKQYGKVIYEFDDNDAKMVVSASVGQSVPSQFDYDVMQVLLKFFEASRRCDKNKVNKIYFSAWEIAKCLGLLHRNKKNGKLSWNTITKNRIDASIRRLIDTSYEIRNLYTVKNGLGKKEVQKYVKFHILENLYARDDLFGDDRSYCVKFNDFFFNA